MSGRRTCPRLTRSQRRRRPRRRRWLRVKRKRSKFFEPQGGGSHSQGRRALETIFNVFLAPTRRHKIDFGELKEVAGGLVPP